MSCFACLPKRVCLAIMIFLMTIISYMTRVNLSICIVAMVEDTENSTRVLPDYGPRYAWSQHDQGHILAAYFIGYCAISMPAGTLAEIFGGKEVASFAMLVTSLLTLLTPASAHWHKWGIFVNRLLLGLVGGTIYPCLHNLISKWVPPQEKGKFMGTLYGGALGTVLTWTASGIIIERIGWDWSFYAVSMCVFIFTILWMCYTADSPAQHKTISKEERDYIESHLIGFGGGKKKIPPYLALFTSIPFWVLMLLQFGSLWGVFFLITATPKYLSEALHFNLEKAGILASLPYLAALPTSFAFGMYVDCMRRKGCIGVTLTRKLFCIFSHIIPGTLLIALGFFGKDPYVCVAVIATAVASSGASSVTNLQLAQDLAPKYAASIYGIITCVGTSSGFISPMVVAYFTQEKSTTDTWCYVFVIAGSIYAIPALFFWLFGSAEVQKWNFIDVVEKEEVKL